MIGFHVTSSCSSSRASSSLPDRFSGAVVPPNWPLNIGVIFNMDTILITEKFWFSQRVLQIQMDLLYHFTRSLAYYRTIHQDYQRIQRCQGYWCHTMNTNLLRAISDWCVVFGQDGNESHWKNLSVEHKPEVTEEVKKVIKRSSGFSDQEWRVYWQRMCDFRSGYVAHRNPEFDAPVPHMDKAFDIAAGHFEWLKEQLRPAKNEPKELRVLYPSFQVEALEVLRDYLDEI